MRRLLSIGNCILLSCTQCVFYMYCFLLVILRCPFFSLLWFSKLRMEGGDLLQLGRPAMVHRSSVQGIYYGVDTGLSVYTEGRGRAPRGTRYMHASDQWHRVIDPRPHTFSISVPASLHGASARRTMERQRDQG
jgi:hypothetical protein